MEGSKLDALGMFHVWLSLEGEKEASFSPPFIFHPIRFYLNLLSIDFRVLFYHGSRPLLHAFPSFSLTYKLQSRILKYPSLPHIHHQVDFDRIYFPVLKFMA